VWFYAIDSTQHGPIDEAAFQDLVAQAVIRGDTMVWRDGMSNWQPYASIPDGFAPRPPGALEAKLEPGESVQCYHCLREFKPDYVIPIGPGLVCGACKPVVLQRMREGTLYFTAPRLRYAGFGLRLVASFIDGLILQIFSVAVAVIFTALLPGGGDEVSRVLVVQGLVMSAGFAAALLYKAYFHSRNGATLGKMAMGIKVIRSDGGPVSFKLAAGRYFAEILSSLILSIGYLMAAWDDEKRALHDRICDTRVIKS
jgi:uncharacterized RDD family membrane protein YckC